MSSASPSVEAMVAEAPPGSCCVCEGALPPGHRRLCGDPECRAVYQLAYQADRHAAAAKARAAAAALVKARAPWLWEFRKGCLWDGRRWVRASIALLGVSPWKGTHGARGLA